MKDKRGFSLIELIAILVIIGLILIVVLPAVSRVMTANGQKYYDNYVTIIKEGANVYADSRKDDLGGSNDTGCIDVTIEELIEEKYITKFNDKNTTCSGNIEIRNEKGNTKVFVDITCIDSEGNNTFKKEEINKEGTCLSFNPDEDDISYITLKQKILDDNTEQSDMGINFGQKSSDTNGKGLYYTSTNTEENKTTYYFRGAVTNNYVDFAGIIWRIVRINEDGSVRLVYQGTTATATGYNATIGYSFFNSSRNDNAYVGYMYGSTGQSGTNAYKLTHANDNPSTIKTVLDTWYVNNLSSYVSYLADAGFCNDRSIAPRAGLWYSDDTALGYSTNRTYYGAYYRLNYLKQPQFACPSEERDLFTTNLSSKGNHALDYPIGLLTADEVSYAGGSSAYNSSYYLYTGGEYWTMSPRLFAPYTNEADPWSVLAEGYLDVNLINYGGVRPVINIKGNVGVKLTGTGEPGTSTNPYIIKTN